MGVASVQHDPGTLACGRDTRETSRREGSKHDCLRWTPENRDSEVGAQGKSLALHGPRGAGEVQAGFVFPAVLSAFGTIECPRSPQTL